MANIEVDARAVLFADLAGFTALSVAHGDVDAAQVAARFFAMTQAALRGDARIVKTIGDAVMVVAATPRAALDTALGLFRAVEEEPECPGVRMGLQFGGIVENSFDDAKRVLSDRAILNQPFGWSLLPTPTPLPPILPTPGSIIGPVIVPTRPPGGFITATPTTNVNAPPAATPSPDPNAPTAEGQEPIYPTPGAITGGG